MRHVYRGLAIGIGLALCAGVASAATIVIDTWDAGDEGWTETDDSGNPNVTSFGGGQTVDGQTALEIVANPPSQFTSAESLIRNLTDYDGNWVDGSFDGGTENVVRSLSFEFYADTAPSNLELYFVSGTGYTWYYQLNVTPGSWNYFGINMVAGNSPGGWAATGRTASEFETDLAQVTEVGFLLAYQDGLGSQTFGIDNFELNDALIVPEPSTYAALGMALLSLGMVFRRRIRESVEAAREKIAA